MNQLGRIMLMGIVSVVILLGQIIVLATPAGIAGDIIDGIRYPDFLRWGIEICSPNGVGGIFTWDGNSVTFWYFPGR